MRMAYAHTCRLLGSQIQSHACREPHVKNEHANGKYGLYNFHQEVDADWVEAEFALRVFAQVHQHRLESCTKNDGQLVVMML